MGGEEAAESFSSVCPIEEDRWSCDLPAGEWDLSIAAPGYVPFFFWETEIVEDESRNLGTLQLLRGSSVSGWVVGSGRGGVAEVVARRVGSGRSANSSDLRRADLPSWRTETDSRGEFQIDSLSPGRFEIHAEREGATSQSVEITITESDSSLGLPEPLDLRPASELHLTIEPPSDPWQRPWNVRLLAPTADPRVMETVEKAEATEKGTWQSEQLPPGPYLLKISDSLDGEWHDRELQLVGSIEDIFIPIDLVEIRGTVTVGSEPLSARIIFGTGTSAVTLQSADDGSFHGYLPAEKEWLVHLAMESGKVTYGKVDVRIPDGKTYFELDVEVPNTRIYGLVTYEDDPIDSLVLALRGELDPRERTEKLRLDLETLTGEDGRFELRGVAPGSFRLRASRGSLVSAWQDVHLEEDDEIELDLELREKRAIRGVTTWDGEPLAGVTILAQARGDLMSSTTSSVDGSFQLEVGPSVRETEVMIVPPIGGLTFRRLSVPEDGGEPVTLPIAPASGDLVLVEPDTRAFLAHDGIRFPTDFLLRTLLGSRAAPHPEVGMALSGVEAGTWHLCPGLATPVQECASGEIVAGGYTKFHLTDPNGDRP